MFIIYVDIHWLFCKVAAYIRQINMVFGKLINTAPKRQG